ncbi:MAG TPA: DUF5667 domain-containing protein [Pseudonocardiaceae bacterium]|nr:DUF5667 domain-containing protein [Pseudonocardiaceae bacterium]
MVRTTRGSEGQGSDEQEQELFAHAVEHAVDAGIRDVSDRVLHRELAVVAVLRQVGARAEATVGPDPAERERMRQRIMAEFSSVVHDGTSPLLPLSSSRKARRTWTTSRNRRWIPDETRGRLAVAAAAALCLLMSLSGMSVLLSRDALPGDALYTFKRSAESAELGLTFGDQPKALKHLEFASARVDEIEMMAEHSQDAGSWSVAQEKFLRALDDFDADASAGARILTALASQGQTDMLSALGGWANQQETRLETIQTALPLPASTRLDSTLGLLDRVVDRASALDHRSECTTVTSGSRDDLGLLPARDACIRPVDGTSSTIPLPDTSDTPAITSPDITSSPDLIGSSPANQIPIPDQKGQRSRSGLPGAPDGVLPTPGQPGTEPSSPLPGSDSSPPAIPLPLPGIPLPLLPPSP